MNLFPVRTVPLASDLPPAALADLLHCRIGDGPAARFAGAVAPESFVIRRVNEFRSTPMPRLSGRLVATPHGGTDVLLRLRPPNVVLAFMAIWLAFLAAVAALILAGHARDAARSLWPLFAPAALAAPSWLLMCSVFAADARWAVESLLTAVPALRAAGSRRPGGPEGADGSGNLSAPAASM